MKKVSIIVPAYNVEKYIYRAIESILRQTYQNIEVIIIDDGSTDRTWNVIKDYSEKYSIIKAYHQANNGVSAARNNGLNQITGDYCIFLDSDDWLEDNAIEYLLNLQMRYPDYMICCDRYFAFLNKQGALVREKQRKVDTIKIVSKKESMRNIGTGNFNLQSSCYKLFNTTLISDLRYNTKIYHGEDGLFVFEYLKRTEGIVFSTEPLWDILERPGSATTSSYNKKWLSAIEAAEIIRHYGKDNPDISLDLDMYYIDRIEMVENAALKSPDYKNNKDDVDFARDLLRQNRKSLHATKISLKYLIKFLAYAYVPISILKYFIKFKEKL